MNSVINNKAVLCGIDSRINEHKTKDNSKNIEKNSNNVTAGAGHSVISRDAAMEYKFLSRIGASSKDADKGHFIEKCTSEYEKIKDEISSGKYGSDTKKYMGLLVNAFKDSVEQHVSNVIKLSGSSLCKCQRQYETATGIVWILRADNKRILKEIEEYRKKKDHSMVNSLTQLSKSYEHVINNVSDTAAMIQYNISDYFEEDKTKI